MILYHFAETSYSELLPAVGSRRHDTEDPRAVGKPVVWLTDSPERAPSVETIAKFRHEVDVDENDPFLFKDESTERLKIEWSIMFPNQGVSARGIETSYFYTKSIPVKSVIAITCGKLE